LVVTLEDSKGRVGAGEAVPLPSYDGVSTHEVLAALEDCRRPLADSDGLEREQLLAVCTRLAVLPQAIAAIDLALWDLAGVRSGQPVWRLLGAPDAPPVAVNATIGATDRAGAAAQAAAARADGFGAIKVKVGAGDDAGRLAAVRAVVGRDVAIRIDANGVWTAEQAVASLRMLEPIGIELCEEPATGLRQIESVAKAAGVRISIDESAVAPGALDTRYCDAVCLKISRCGGISGVIDATRRARATGYSVYLSSTLDGPLGIAAALHAATIVRPDRPSGLATLGMFDGGVHPLRTVDGFMNVPGGSGLGDALRAWYRPG
jgi:L-alanine-DL-glutamate epimerase-like enolase superfamily enzyme